ncbi:MAG: MFS transporter [Candidatus Obscuribacterales bacterium]|nr:MFS transporter [Candidatus Obscuribacterales bacterium]
MSDQSATLKKISLRLMPYLLVLYVVAYLDRINISFAALQMNKELGFSDEMFGLGAGIFFVGYFLFGLPSNLVIERLGARRWIALIMILWGLISVAMIFVKTALVFYALRFLLGVAEAGFFPGMILYLTYWYPREHHGFAVARFMTAIPLAGVLGGLLCAQILPLKLFEISGWQWLFIFTGSPAVILGLSVLFFLPDGPADASWLNESEKEWLALRIQPRKAPSTFVLDKAIFSKVVWHLALIYFCLTLGMYGFQLWLPQIIQSFGRLNLTQVGFLSAIPAVFQALGMILIALSSDRTGERKKHVAAACFLAALSLVASGLTNDANWALLGLSLTAFGIWGVVGPFWALPVHCLPGAALPGSIALINSLGNLGGFAGPYLIGVIKQQKPDFIWSLSALAVSLTLAGLLTLSLKTDYLSMNKQK